MPIITVHGPALADTDKKRALVKKMTEVASEAFGIPQEAFIILLRETCPETVSIGGKLLSDRHKKAD